MTSPATTTGTANVSLSYIKRNQLPSLLQKLSRVDAISIKIKRTDRLNEGNFTTVARASFAVIILRDVVTGATEILPDISVISEFQLSDNFDQCKGNVAYIVIP